MDTLKVGLIYSSRVLLRMENKCATAVSILMAPVNQIRIYASVGGRIRTHIEMEIRADKTCKKLIENDRRWTRPQFILIVNYSLGSWLFLK